MEPEEHTASAEGLLEHGSSQKLRKRNSLATAPQTSNGSTVSTSESKSVRKTDRRHRDKFPKVPLESGDQCVPSTSREDVARPMKIHPDALETMIRSTGKCFFTSPLPGIKRREQRHPERRKPAERKPVYSLSKDRPSLPGIPSRTQTHQDKTKPHQKPPAYSLSQSRPRLPGISRKTRNQPLTDGQEAPKTPEGRRCGRSPAEEQLRIEFGELTEV